MIYKKNKTSCSRKRKDDTLDHCLVKVLQLMQEPDHVVCLVQSPAARMRELAHIFHSEFPSLQCSMSLAPGRAPAAT
jgi:hypothetical protein